MQFEERVDISRQRESLAWVKSLLEEERHRLEKLATQLDSERRHQEFVKKLGFSLLRDFINAVNQEEDTVADIANSLAFLLRAPSLTSEIHQASIVEIIDDVLTLASPAARQVGCRFLVMPGEFNRSRAEIDVPQFQEALFHLILQYLASNDSRDTVIEVKTGDHDVTLNFSDHFLADMTPGLQQVLGRNGASWSNGQFSFPARPHTTGMPPDTGLHALVLANSDMEGRSIAARLLHLGVHCMEEFNPELIDLCLVSDETDEAFKAVLPQLPDSVRVLLLGNRKVQTERRNALWFQVEDPVTQKALSRLISDLGNLRGKSASRKVLVVDDSEMNARLLAMQLQELGHSVTLAESGTEALSQVEQHDFDLILMDMQMPDIRGDEVTRRIRSSRKKVPVIALTAHATRQEREEYQAAGIDEVIIKPLRMEKLKAVMQGAGLPAARPPLSAGVTSRVPVFDPALALANANQRPELAAELLDLLVAGLPEEQRAINQVADNYAALNRAVHKLSGAIRYSGVPRLARAIDRLEAALKQNDDFQIPLLINLLNGEIAALLNWHRENPNIFS